MSTTEPNNRLTELLQKYVAKTINEEEYNELFGYLADQENKEKVLSFMDEHQKDVQAELNVHETDWDSMYANITNKGNHANHRILNRWKVAIAAMLVVTAGYTIYRISSKQAFVAKQEYTYKNDVAPGGNKAILTLADGSQIALTNHANGNLATDGKITIEKDADGQLVYHIKNENSNGEDGSRQLKYNTVTTPAGGTYCVILSDGSKVWLNAASSLKFPIAFAKDQRKVEVSGEAYFEIEKDQTRPFLVQNGNSEIKVLGTHFDIMSYHDESLSKVTLLEGSVQFTKNNRSELLKPGFQILYQENSTNTKQQAANVEEVMAWKNGLFVFNNTTIDQIMKDLIRWYNIEVKYEGSKPDIAFTGVIPRNANVSKVLKALEATGDVKFDIDGQVITCAKKSKK